MGEKQERSINELIDLPYNEMTQEEAERVINYKAAILARDAEYSETCKRQKETLRKIAEIHQEAANEALNTLNLLTQNALNEEAISREPK